LHVGEHLQQDLGRKLGDLEVVFLGPVVLDRWHLEDDRLGLILDITFFADTEVEGRVAIAKVLAAFAALILGHLGRLNRRGLKLVPVAGLVIKLLLRGSVFVLIVGDDSGDQLEVGVRLGDIPFMIPANSREASMGGSLPCFSSRVSAIIWAAVAALIVS